MCPDLEDVTLALVIAIEKSPNRKICSEIFVSRETLENNDREIS